MGHATGGVDVGLDISCSKGTYIRSLGCDLAESIGSVGHLSVLRRLSSDVWCGHFEVSHPTTGGETGNARTGSTIGGWHSAKKVGRFSRVVPDQKCWMSCTSHWLSPEYVLERCLAWLPTLKSPFDWRKGCASRVYVHDLPSTAVIRVLWDDRMLALVRSDGTIVRVNPSIADMRIAQQSAI